MSDRLKSLLELFNKDPDDSFLSYGIALEYISQQNYKVAEKYLTSLNTKNPDYVPAYMQLAHVKEQLNKLDEAIDIYKKGIEVARNQNEMHAANEMEDFLNELK